MNEDSFTLMSLSRLPTPQTSNFLNTTYHCVKAKNVNYKTIWLIFRTPKEERSLSLEVYIETLILGNSEEEYLDKSLPPPVVSVLSHQDKASLVCTSDCLRIGANLKNSWTPTPSASQWTFKGYYMFRKNSTSTKQHVFRQVCFIITRRLPSWGLTNKEQSVLGWRRNIPRW